MDFDPASLAAPAPTEQAAAAGAALPPLPRRVLGRGTLALLVLLRAYVAVAVPVVGYAFVHAMLASHP